MKSFLLLCSLACVVSLENLCMNCKHFKNQFFSDKKFGKCALFPRERTDYYLVDGSSPDVDNYYCSTAREFDEMCGKNREPV